MKREYKRELNHTYLILPGSEREAAGYQECMLEKNRIEGLLSCQIRYVDNNKRYYYEISSKQPLCHIYSVSKMRYDELVRLIYAIEAVILEMERYLLDSSRMLLTADMIYWDLEQNKAWLIYYPEAVSEEENLIKAGEDLLELIDYTDERAVETAHFFYECSREKNFCWNRLTEYIEEKQQEEVCAGDETSEETIDSAPMRTGGEGRNNKADDAGCPEAVLSISRLQKKMSLSDEKGLSMIRIWLKPVVILGIVLATGIFLWRNYIFSLSEMAAGAFFYAVTAAVVLIRTGIRIKRDRAEECVENKEEEYRQEQTQNRLYWKENDSEENPERFDGGDALSEDKTEDAGCYGETVCLSICEEEEERRLEGRIKGKEVLIFLDNMPFLVGKMKGRVSYVLADASVSRLHAAFREEDGRLLLRDLQSRNGTYKNEIRLEAGEELEVRPGDEIRFGKLRFTYR